MATLTITLNKTLPDSSDKADFHELVSTATVGLTTGTIVNADISGSAAIADSKLASITTAGKVAGSALTTLTGVPSGAGALPNANMGDSTTVTAAPASDHTASGTKISLTANENQAFGDVCYINTDGEAQLGDADAIATSKIAVMCADASISADASGNYLVMGIARDDTWAWTVGGYIYLSTTGTTTNTLTQTAPSGADDCIVIVGIATHADRMIFNPSYSIVEHTG